MPAGPPVYPETPGVDGRHNVCQDLHMTTNTNPAGSTQVIVIGLDGRSRPMYRYAVDMHLSDHQRRIVAAEHRPAGR